jgi:rhodanese-related sulfurtransferase
VVSTFAYRAYRQKQEYAKWLAQTQVDGTVVPPATPELDTDGDGLSDRAEVEQYGTNPHHPDTDGDGYTDGTEVLHGYSPTVAAAGAVQPATQQGSDSNNQLAFETAAVVSLPKQPFASSIEASPDDKVALLVEKYYGYIARHQLAAAYELSSHEVSLPTFESWYSGTTAITLDRYVAIDERRGSVELTLFEGSQYTRYGVVVAARLGGDTEAAIERSDVQVLGRGEAGVVATAHEAQPYYESHSQAALVMTNDAFRKMTNGNTAQYVVLDARENIEYENGRYPSSTHIRFADLKAGRWIELPRDRQVVVLCWSGIRGREVAEFLRSKKIVASYLEDGANGWVQDHGRWDGNILFGSKYSEERFRLVFDTPAVRQSVAAGVVLVDTREPSVYAKSHIRGSVNIPTMYTPTADFDRAFAQVAPGSRVITVCDGYVNCFDAKITGVELEQRGHTFLGRYNKPWEYGP